MSDELQDLSEWSVLVRAELGLGAVDVDIDAVLSLAGTAARAVRRPAAPLTTYLVGIAVGRAVATGSDPLEAARAATAAVERLAAERPAAEHPAAEHLGTAE